MSTSLKSLSPIRQTILTLIKQEGSMTMKDLGARCQVSYEAVRQQVAQMEKEGWLERKRIPQSRVGPPTSCYTLTPKGDHLFPKYYDVLAIELIDTVAEKLGPDELRQILASLVEVRVKKWQPLLEGKSLEERLEVLKGIYLEDDPFISIESGENGLRLIERNCPFLNIAHRRPTLCSVTVSILTQLLGVRVVREERFQNGDGRCAFKIYKDDPIHPNGSHFDLEPPTTAHPSTS